MLKHADRTHCKVAELGKSPKYLPLLWHGRGHCRPDHIAVVFDGRKRKQPLCQRSADVDICPKEVVVIKVRVLLPVCSSAIPMSARYFRCKSSGSDHESKVIVTHPHCSRASGEHSHQHQKSSSISMAPATIRSHSGLSCAHCQSLCEKKAMRSANGRQSRCFTKIYLEPANSARKDAFDKGTLPAIPRIMPCESKKEQKQMWTHGDLYSELVQCFCLLRTLQLT